MSVRKSVLAALFIIIFFAGTAFAFPYDPNPGSIHATNHGRAAGTGAGPGYVSQNDFNPYDYNANNLFPGNWTNTLRSLSVNYLRLFEFKNNEFGIRPDGTPDTAKLDSPYHRLNIWKTPSFTDPVKMASDSAAWRHLKNNPGANVPPDIGLSMYTTQSEMINFIEALPKTHLTVEYLGEIPRGFPFPFLIFSRLLRIAHQRGLKQPVCRLYGVRGIFTVENGRAGRLTWR